METHEKTDLLDENALSGFLTVYTDLRRKTNAVELLDTLQKEVLPVHDDLSVSLPRSLIY